MEQHPIPQNISSYQFRLVGDMTLKQFFELGAGLLMGFIFYSLPTLAIIKWPFAIISVILGAALAFVPLEERPLERWIFAFFRAIYTPTEFIWKKTVASTKFFQDEPTEVPTAPANPALNDYLATSKQTPASSAKLENGEQGFMSKISGLFAGFKVPQVSKPAVQSTNQLINNPIQTSPVGSITVDTPAAPVVNSAPPQDKPELTIPQTAPIRVAQPGAPKMVVEERAPSIPITTQPVSPVIAGNEMVSTRQAIFSVDAAPPSPPTIPNVVVGQAVDAERKIIESAIMEIRDEAGRPIRALRSNKLGHFITVTPLDNGKYEIITEKDGYEFTPVSFEARGEIIPPILVQGKRIAGYEAPVPIVPIKQQYVPALSPNFQ